MIRRRPTFTVKLSRIAALTEAGLDVMGVWLDALPPCDSLTIVADNALPLVSVYTT